MAPGLPTDPILTAHSTLISHLVAIPEDAARLDQQEQMTLMTPIPAQEERDPGHPESDVEALMIHLVQSRTPGYRRWRLATPLR